MSAVNLHLDVLAFGAHPDDVELGCGALLALLSGRGYAVGACHLTRGENGTRGSGEQRISESEAAAQVLGLDQVHHLDCGDAGLRVTRREEDAIIELIRQTRPGLLLIPPPRDRHPDHERAHRLVHEAAFYSGLAKRSPELGDPHRPGSSFWYMLHQTFEPSVLVDVTPAWGKKMQALAEYESQFAARNEAKSEAESPPATYVSSSSFWAAIEGRGRHYGQQIGVEFAEPLACRLPVPMHDPLWLLGAARP